MKLPHYSMGTQYGKSLLTPLVVLTLVPPACLAIVMIFRTTDLPWNDQWDFVLTLEKFYSGTLTAADLWTPQNEHHIPVAKAVLLAIAWVTHWDLRAETAANFLAGVAVFAILCRKWARTAADTGTRNALLLLPVLSMLIFSLSQWQSWFFGWQLCVYLEILAVVAGLLLLSGPGLRSFLGAIACGLAATFSFGTGLMYWPAAISGMELCLTKPPMRPALNRLGLYTAGLVVPVMYLWGYRQPDGHPALAVRPLEFATYFLAYTGAPIISYHVAGAALMGALGLAVFLWLTLVSRKRGIGPAGIGFYQVLAVFAVFGALMTTVARAGFGPIQALSSRYIPLSTLFWVSLVSLLHIRLSRRHIKALVTAWAALFALLCVNSAYGTLKWDERYDFRLPAKAELLHGDNPDLLQRLHPDPAVVLERREVLKRHGLGIFHGNWRDTGQ